MQPALLIVALVAPALIAYKHNQQAQHMLEGRLYRMDVDQSPATRAFKGNRPLLIGNLILIFGADLAIGAMFLHEVIARPMVIAAVLIGAAIVVFGAIRKAQAISAIHKSVLGR